MIIRHELCCRSNREDCDAQDEGRSRDYDAKEVDEASARFVVCFVPRGGVNQRFLKGRWLHCQALASRVAGVA